MKVTFVKKSSQRYVVEVRRDRYPDLWCGTVGYDDWLPHDLLHFVAEAEFGLDGGVFGDLAAGGNARIFQPADRKLAAKMWRKERIRRTRLPDGRRSEQFAGELQRGWREKTRAPELQQQLDALARRWNALQPGGSITLEWPRPEGRRHHPPRERRRPVAARRR